MSPESNSHRDHRRIAVLMMRLSRKGQMRRQAAVAVTMQGSMGKHKSPTSGAMKVMLCATFPKATANLGRMPVGSSANPTSARSLAKLVYRQ